jgi:hypothetical protein
MAALYADCEAEAVEFYRGFRSQPASPGLITVVAEFASSHCAKVKRPPRAKLGFVRLKLWSPNDRFAPEAVVERHAIVHNFVLDGGSLARLRISLTAQKVAGWIPPMQRYLISR